MNKGKTLSMQMQEFMYLHNFCSENKEEEQVTEEILEVDGSTKNIEGMNSFH